MLNPARIIVTLLLVVGVGGASYYVYQQNKDEPTVQEASQQINSTVNSVNAVVNFSQDGKTVSYDGVEGETALKTLKSLTTAKTEKSSFGEFVSGIKDVQADAKKEYWAFYVNGQMAAVGAGDYVQKAGDKIEWRLEKL